MSSIPHLVRWHAELGDFGLVVIGPHAQKASEKQVKAKAQALGVNYAVVENASVKDGHDFKGIPHCMLFDHTGKCLFRGSPNDAETHLRAAVGKALVDGLGTTSKPVAALADGLGKGQAPQTILQKAVPLLKSTHEATATEAKLLVEKLTAGGQKRVEQAEALTKDDPIGAYLKLERVPIDFKGTPVAAKADELLAALKKDKTVVEEIKARPSLEAIKKLETVLQAQTKDGKLDPKDANFQKLHAATLGQLKGNLQKMKKSFPEAKATQEAAAIADKFGVIVR